MQEGALNALLLETQGSTDVLISCVLFKFLKNHNGISGSISVRLVFLTEITSLPSG